MVNVDNVASEIGLRGLYLLQIILPPASLAQGAESGSRCCRERQALRESRHTCHSHRVMARH